MWKLSLPLATKLSFITVCKGCHQYTTHCFSCISTEECACQYSKTRSRSNISSAYTCWKTLIKLTFATERLYWLTEGWYRNISLLLVPHTNSLNSLVEALVSLSLFHFLTSMSMWTSLWVILFIMDSLADFLLDWRPGHLSLVHRDLTDTWCVSVTPKTESCRMPLTPS